MMELAMMIIMIMINLEAVVESECIGVDQCSDAMLGTVEGHPLVTFHAML